jgi:pimeloyl-ACP methyl ester carboxylesterase
LHAIEFRHFTTHFGIAGEALVKRWEKVCGIVGAIFLSLGAIAVHRGIRDIAERDFTVSEQGCNTPVTQLDSKETALPRGTAVVIHGLCANRKIMYAYADSLARAGFRVYTLDLPGHGVNSDPFTYPQSEKCAAAALETLTQPRDQIPGVTILAGHSMGGAIAVRMADRDPVTATIAISPGPMVLPRRMPSNLLVFTAGHDIGILRREAQTLAAAAEGTRTSEEDFRQSRAFELVRMPHATHTSLLLSPEVINKSIAWAIEAAAYPSGTRTEILTVALDSSIWGSLIGLVGIFLLFPSCATSVTHFAGPKRAEIDDPYPSRSLALAESAICALFGVLILTLGTPLRFLHLYAGDYWASFLFVTGGLFLVLNWKDALECLSPNFRRGIATAALGLLIILAIGAWLNWHMTEAWLNGPRWLRFTGLFPFLWVYSYGEEVMLGPVRIGWRRAARYLVFLVLRLILWTACAVAAYKLPNGRLILVVLLAFLAQFSILQRLATDALRLRTGSAPAAATFGAILASWFIASVFPLT